MSEGEKMSKNKLNLNNLQFCVFDLETTGGNHTKDGIIEIGLVIIENKKISKQKNYLINPGQKIPEFIQKLTTITDKDVESAPDISEVIDEILDIMSGKILVAHNTSFDVPFFNSVLRRLGKEALTNKSICTNLMTKFLIPNMLNTNLTYMAKVFNLDHGKAHRALDDAKASAQLLLKYLDIFEQKNIEKINHLYYPRNKYELDRVHIKSSQFSSKEISLILSNLNSPFLFIIKGKKGVLDYVIPMTPNERGMDLLKERLFSKNRNWETLTIQIFGSFSETYLNFLKYVTKLKFDQQNEVKSDLIQAFNVSIEKYESLKKEIKEKPDETIKNRYGNFIIVGHLVENQFIIFSTLNMSAKNSLVFKFPAHQKKLQQFISSRVHKKASLKYVPISFYTILVLISEQMNEHIMSTYKDIKKKQVPDLISTLEKQLSKYQYPHNYPQKYI